MPSPRVTFSPQEGCPGCGQAIEGLTGPFVREVAPYHNFRGLQKSEIEGLSSEVESLKESNAQLAEQITTIEVLEMAEDGETIEKDYHVHIVKQGESLWSIAEKYHDDCFKHEEIAGHNELNDPHFIEVGDTVIIKK